MNSKCTRRIFGLPTLGTLAALSFVFLTTILICRLPRASADTITPRTPDPPASALSVMGDLVTAPRAVIPPVLDGNLSEWQSLSPIQLTSDNASTIVGEIPSPTDLSASLRIVWTSNALYFAGVITDEVLIGNDSINVWNDDSIELSMASGGRSHQFTLGIDGRKLDQGTPVIAVQMITKTVSGGWLFEASIPSALLGGDLQGDQELPFTWALWDDDIGHGATGQTHLFWQSDNTYSYRPTWGILRLAPLQTPTRTLTPTSTRTRTPTVTKTPTATRRISSWTYLPLVVRRWPPIPETPILDPVTAPEGNSNYSVMWHATQDATSYVLEQTRDSAFDNSVQVYTGPGTSVSIPSQGVATYYYRVKARNSWGESAWSNVQAVEVRWESEPNDQIPELTNRNQLLFGKEHYGAMSSDRDVDPAIDQGRDYFFFDVSATQTVEIRLRNIPTGSDYDLYVRPDWDVRLILGQSVKAGNAEEYIRLDSLPVGHRYFVQILNRNRTRSTEPYRLSLQ